MSNNAVVKSKVVMGVCFTVLSAASGLASCGGGIKDNGDGNNVVSTIYASASPALIAPGETSIITWFSIDKKTTCSATPTAQIGASTGDKTISGSFTTVPLTATTEFSIKCGDVSRRVIVSVPPAAIHAAAKACADEAEPVTNVYYYCDCGTGATTGCVPGDDGNAGTSKAAPRRTLSNAASRLSSLTGTGNTIAFCKGGAFDSNARYWNGLSNSSCAAGSICNTIRDYTPTTPWSNAKPIINNPTTGSTFAIAGNYGGLRLLNLSLMGDNGAYNNGNQAFFFYRGAHDVTMCNLDMDAFDAAVTNQSGGDTDAQTKNIILTASNITNTRRLGYLGAGENAEISLNNWEENASSNDRDHTIYLSTSKTAAILNVSILGNYIHGQASPICYGAVLIGHGAIDGLLIKNNTIALEPSRVAPSCWGIGINNHTNASHAQFYRNAIISGNTVINSGSIGITISTCPACKIENNVIVQNWAANGATGISLPVYPADTTRGDDISTANVIRNNTIWFGPNFTGTGTGIDTNTEGIDHVISNNTISSAQTTGSLVCFRNRLQSVPNSYLFIDNNNCYATTVSSKWEYGTLGGSLATWQGSGFDLASNTGNPGFVAPGTNFKPTGTTLVGKGTSAHMSAADITGAPRPSPPAIGAYEP